MAHFRGEIRGRHGLQTRLGNKKSGVTASAYGWDVGGCVTAFYDSARNKDVIVFSLTGGANEGCSPIYIGVGYARKNGKIVFRRMQYRDKRKDRDKSVI